MKDGGRKKEDEKYLPPSVYRLPPFHFIGGKGGVGKTTCAAIAALRHAHGTRSTRTLLVTTDPASSLAAALGMRVGSVPVPVRGAKGLHAARVDAARAFERWLEPRRDLVAAIALRGTWLDEEDVGRILRLSLPGIDEVIGLLEISRMSAGFDAVVVDTAPTGHTLRLLAAPALLGRAAHLLDALQSHHRIVVSALRGAYRTDAADALITELEKDGTVLAARLRDPASTELTWVTLPEPMALEETADAIAALGAAGIRVSRLIVNRVTAPPPQRCAFCDARRRFEARALAPAASRFAGREILALPEAEKEPVGVAALRALGTQEKPWVPTAVPRPIDHRVRAVLELPPEGGSHTTLGNPVASPFSRNTQWLLFGGKGGVGKSTCAAAAALDLAEDRRVLLVSTDPAHSLSDVFGARFDNEPRAAPGAPGGLRVREIDAAAEMDRFRRTYVEAVDDAFARIARGAAGDRAAFHDLIDLAPPGIDEIIGVADIAEAIAEGKGGFDVIVTDTAPTGHALRLLQTPALLRGWTQALMAILLKYREIVGAGTLAALLVQLSKRLRALQAILADGARTRFVVVTRAAALPSDESATLITELERLGISVAAMVVNAAGRGRCRRCRTIAAAQQKQVRALERLSRAKSSGLPRAASRGYAIIEAPAEVPPPHGVRALREWRRNWTGGQLT